MLSKTMNVVCLKIKLPLLGGYDRYFHDTANVANKMTETPTFRNHTKTHSILFEIMFVMHKYQMSLSADFMSFLQLVKPVNFN